MATAWPEFYLIHTQKSSSSSGFETLIINRLNGCCIRREYGQTADESSYRAVEQMCKRADLIPPPKFQAMEVNEVNLRG